MGNFQPVLVRGWERAAIWTRHGRRNDLGDSQANSMARRPHWVGGCCHPSSVRVYKANSPSYCACLLPELPPGDNSGYVMFQKPELGHNLLKP